MADERFIANPKPGSQGMRGRIQGNAAPRLPEVLEISIDVIWREGFEGVSLLVQKGEEALNVPLPALARCQGQSPAPGIQPGGNLRATHHGGQAAALDRAPTGQAVARSYEQQHKTVPLASGGRQPVPELRVSWPRKPQ